MARRRVVADVIHNKQLRKLLLSHSLTVEMVKKASRGRGFNLPPLNGMERLVAGRFPDGQPALTHRASPLLQLPIISQRHLNYFTTTPYQIPPALSGSV
jgi:hypothetical protein